jgi:hypothetical protein
MSRTSARDFEEALLLDVHHAQFLQKHPHVAITRSLVQDQILGDAEETLKRHGGSDTLDQLHREARETNLEDSHGRMNTDWIEPEKLFWAAWHRLPAGEKSKLAHEAVGHFVAYVLEATTADPRENFKEDPLEWHRHRIHPLLWQALAAAPTGEKNDAANRELRAWQAKQEEYLARRPVWSQIPKTVPPWEEAK